MSGALGFLQKACISVLHPDILSTLMAMTF